MKKLTTEAFSDVCSWIYRNARQIELVKWQYEFENRSREAVFSALSYYQNEDGGFGNALEPDSWNPNSSPYTTLKAIEKLKELGSIEKNHPIILGIFKFLESGVHSNENGWLFSIPSNDNWPRAPWWTYSPEAEAVEGIGVSAGILCFLLKFANNDSELYKKAFSIAGKLINKLSVLDNFGDMGVSGYCVLLETINELGLTQGFNVKLLEEKTRKLVYETIERDVSKWPLYGKRPSYFITSPTSFFYEDNKNIVEQELDYLIETKPEQGVWGITWSWYEHNEKFPKEFAIAENWWKADGAIEKLKFLRNFNRIEKAS